MKIFFNLKENAFLPEYYEYKKYFESFGFETESTKHYTIKQYEPDVIWNFMGFDISQFQNKKHKVIHEYLSGSTGQFPYAKNYIKRKINVKPNHRFFLNNYVKNLFPFKDQVPYTLRNMGVSDSFFHIENQTRDGAVCVSNKATEHLLRELLDNFSTLNQKMNLTVIGHVDGLILEKYKKLKNITFLGSIAYERMALSLSQFEYGIVLYDNIAPFKYQTSTRVLEYCAAGLKVIATPLEWITIFFQERNARYLSLESIQSLDFQKIEESSFLLPNVTDLSWVKILDNCHVKETLEKLKNN